MAIESRGFNSGIIQSAADLSGIGNATKGQFKLIVLTAALTANLVSTKGGRATGVLQNKPKAGEAMDIMHIGLSKVVIGAGGLVAGTQYEADADGTAITAEVGKIALGEVVIGGAAGELGTVTIGLPGGITVGA